jgi:formylmethanofuran dehydrogenase subunit D
MVAVGDGFMLVTGRTPEQGRGLYQGKYSEAYEHATAWVAACREDMADLRIEEGQIIRLRTATGQVELPIRAGDLPTGLLFMPMGPLANLLVGEDTDGTGMPRFKGVAAALEVV